MQISIFILEYFRCDAEVCVQFIVLRIDVRIFYELLNHQNQIYFITWGLMDLPHSPNYALKYESD